MTASDDATASRFDGELLIDAVIAPKLSFASHQNDVPVLHELKLLNLGDTAAENVLLRVESDPPVFAAREWRFDRIASGGEVHVTQRDLPLNAALLLQLSEAVRATVTLTARIEGCGRRYRRTPRSRRTARAQRMGRRGSDARTAGGVRATQRRRRLTPVEGGERRAASGRQARRH